MKCTYATGFYNIIQYINTRIALLKGRLNYRAFGDERSKATR